MGGLAKMTPVTQWIEKILGTRIRERLQGDLHEAQSEIDLLLRIATALARSVSLDDMVKLVADECLRALKADAICVYLLRPNDIFEMVESRGCTPGFRHAWRLVPKNLFPNISDEDPYKSFFFGSATAFKTMIPSSRKLVEKSGRKAIAYAPLLVDKKIIGLIGFSYNQMPESPLKKTFTLTLVNLCAQAVDRAQIWEMERIARQEAESANRAKTDFLANVSHEIRTPIGIIQGYADLFCRCTDLPEKQRQWSAMIRRNVRQLNEVVGEVLDISRIEADKLDIERIPFSLSELLEDLRAMALFKAEKSKIKFEFIPHDLPQFIMTDPIRLKQILINLVGNAIKFTRVGGVRLEVFCHGGTLEFFVKDTGVGIPAAHQSKIFEPFNQADCSTKRNFGGTGLGLSIAKKLGLALGGDVLLVKSEPSVGSVFLLTVPFELVKDLPPVQKREEPLADLTGLRVLLVEDSIDNQELVALLLSEAGASVDVADGALKGIQLALSNHYHVVLMDIQMPDLDGHEAVARLRAGGYDRPIAALTANAVRSEKEKSVRQGFDDYLTKPIDIPVLIAAIKRLSENQLLH